jgi:DNA-binding CsgD family transcriptional regulator
MYEFAESSQPGIDMTDREREILALMVKGLSNKKVRNN